MARDKGVPVIQLRMDGEVGHDIVTDELKAAVQRMRTAPTTKEEIAKQPNQKSWKLPAGHEWDTVQMEVGFF